MRKSMLLLVVIGVVALAALGAYAIAQSRAANLPAPDEQAVSIDDVAQQGVAHTADCPGFEDADGDGVCDVRRQCGSHDGGHGRHGMQHGCSHSFAGPCH